MLKRAFSSSKVFRHHGHFKKDLYNNIRFDQSWQERIIKREGEIFDQWKTLTEKNWASWKTHVFKRTDPGMQEQIPEKYGDYVYFVKERQFPNNQNRDRLGVAGSGPSSYIVYCRYRLDEVKSRNQEEESVLDIVDDLSLVMADGEPFVKKR